VALPYFLRGYMKKILILTGCAGFIGLNLLKELIKDYDFMKSYHDIISIDKMGYATNYNSLTYYKLCDLYGISTIDEDINNLPNVRNKLFFNPLEAKDITYDILDFASESHVDNSIADPFSIFNQNVSIPAKLLEWIGKDNWKNINVYYHISTDEVYSEIPLDKVNFYANWFKTTDPFKPNNPYSASKVAQDSFLMSLRHTFGLNVKFIRMANQFGNYQHPEKMVPASVLRVLKGEPIKVYGEGLNVRQWTPVNITVEIILDILKNKIVFDDIIHIADREGVFNNNHITEMMIKILKDFGYESKKEYIKDRLGHDSAYALDTTKLIDSYFWTTPLLDLNYYKTEGTENHLRKTIKFYIDNKETYLGNNK